MSRPDSTDARYRGHDYLAANPSWDAEDSPWKAGLVRDLLARHGLRPASVVDIGCGAGVVLSELRRSLPEANLVGYDLAPDAQRFWAAHAALGVTFRVADFLAEASVYYLALLLDVIEHVPNPFDFLERMRGRARHVVLHIPLDLSAVSVLRETPLLHVRRKVGHIHYFTKALALELMRETGYEVIEASFTGAGLSAPGRTLRTRLAGLPRRVAALFSRDLAARLPGGETLLVLARSAA